MIGYDAAFVARGACGCGVDEQNVEVCAETTSFETCSECCPDSGFDDFVSYGGFNGAEECTCFATSPLVEQ